MFGAARRAHHRRMEQMRIETAQRNAREAAERQQRAYADQMRRMQEESARQMQAVMTQQAEAYRKQAEATIEASRMQIQKFEEREEQQRQATELQKRLAIQAGASQARGGASADVQIAPASQAPQTAGTQQFKVRKQRLPIKSAYKSKVNVGQSSTLNV